ncbi:UDP-N-acetylmuramate--L-alanine ligase [candidate division KSB1 bacterium]|nr:UDP-N-acetylmuramate--L-alanine ligase [candidate division KSB1 bacterium]
MLGRTRRIHFVGIGGIGMSGIAEVLLNLGFQVTGSDQTLTPVTDRLSSIGAVITEGHGSDQVQHADVIVISSAIQSNNPEVQEANLQKIPVIRRAEMLGELMRMKQGVAIAGTHGKTTTSSIAGLILQDGGYDPTLIIGGKLRNLDTNAKLGAGDYMVVEADEYDRSFLKLTPTIAAITNIETEHLDCYKDLDEIKDAFVSFANKVPFHGAVILCLDETSLQSIMPRIGRRILTYGLNPQAEVRAVNPIFKETISVYTAVCKGQELGQITLHLPGIHNVKNSLAALAVGLELEIPFKIIQKSIAKFTGVHRRFEIKAEIQDRLIVDDYAHHPTEIRATLKGARDGWKRRVVAVFQPHLYSRTRDFYQDFGQSFFDADILIVTDIYPAREKPIPDVTGELVSNAARDLGHKHVYYIEDKNDVPKVLENLSNPGDMIITLGAGDIWKMGESFIQNLQKETGEKR